jgi:hypothetical protein
MTIDFREILDLVEVALPTMVWRRDPHVQGFECFMGVSAEWNGIAVKHAAGYDGTMTNLRQGLVVHLPADLAQKAFESGLAQEQQRAP